MRLFGFIVILDGNTSPAARHLDGGGKVALLFGACILGTTLYRSVSLGYEKGDGFFDTTKNVILGGLFGLVTGSLYGALGYAGYNVLNHYAISGTALNDNAIAKSLPILVGAALSLKIDEPIAGLATIAASAALGIGATTLLGK